MDQQKLFDKIDSISGHIFDMSDFIFDHPECDGNELAAAELLSGYLEENGFAVERGIADLPSAFRAVFKNGVGGPNFGILVEYDAIIGVGHACGHHMQGPALCAAAVALKEAAGEKPFTVTVYGTPAEETFGGKINMLEAGYITECDIALMTHASPTTTTDIKCMACATFDVTYHGTPAHTAIAPDKGRSALDAVMLALHAVEFMREHVKEDTRMHYIITNGGQADNVVPETASFTIGLRSYNSAYLDTVVAWFTDVLKGAALMTGTTYDVNCRPRFESKIPVLKLNKLLMDKAVLVNAPKISPPREKTGSTDLGNVMYRIPGSCIRVSFTESETAPAHSKEYLESGKGERVRTAILVAAKVTASACAELLDNPALLDEIKEEFLTKKAALASEI